MYRGHGHCPTFCSTQSSLTTEACPTQNVDHGNGETLWAASFEGSTEIHVAYGPSEEDWSRTRSPVAILCIFPGPENQHDPLYLEILPCFLAFMSMCPAYSEVDDCYSKGGSACRKFGRCTNVDQSANVPSTWRLL